MKLVDYVKAHKWRDRIRPEETHLEDAFQDLCAYSGEENPDWNFFGGNVRSAPVRRTLERWKELDEHEKKVLMSQKYTEVDPAEGGGVNRWEAGFVLRAFPGMRHVYEDLNERWAADRRYVIVKNGKDTVINCEREKIVPRLALSVKANEAEESFTAFARLYRGLSSPHKAAVLQATADLYHLSENPLIFVGDPHESGPFYMSKGIDFILRAAIRSTPHAIDKLVRPSTLRSMGYTTDHRFIYQESDQLIGINEQILPHERPAWEYSLPIAAQHAALRPFFNLNSEERQALTEAHHFFETEKTRLTKGNETQAPFHLELAYRSGLGLSIKRGTVLPWARAIVEHYRSGSVGGTQYRALARGAVA